MCEGRQTTLKSAKKMLALTAAVLFTFTNAYADGSAADKLSFKAESNGFEISALETFDFTDRMSITLLKSGKNFGDISSETDAENDVLDLKLLNGSEIKSKLYQKNISDLPEYGWYNIKVNVTQIDKSYDSVVYRYSKLSDDQRSTFWNAFAKCDADEFYTVWNAYAKNLYYEDDYNELYNNANKIGKYYVLMRDAFFDVSSSDTFTLENDVLNCCKYALSFYSALNNNKEEACGIVKKYGLPYYDIYEYQSDFDALYTTFNGLKDNVDYNNFDLFIKKIFAYANLQDGSYKRTVLNKSNCITKYAEYLGADLKYAKENGIEVNSVASEYNSEESYKYFTDANWFKKIVDKLYQKSNTNTSTSTKKGGSGGGYKSSVDPVVPTPEPINSTDENIPDIVGFDDLDGFDWAKDDIINLCGKNVVNGVGNAKFAPAEFVKREEFAAMIVKAFKVTYQLGKDIEFSDVTSDFWADEYIKTASSAELLNGNDDGTFGVGNAITRQDMAVIMLNVMKINNLSIIPDDTNYSDKQLISHYADTAVATLSQINILNGFSDGTFRPFDNVTRAQAAVAVNRLMLYMGR